MNLFVLSCGIIHANVFRSQPSGAANQATELQREGVEVTRTAMGEYTVDLEVYGWFPEELAEEE